MTRRFTPSLLSQKSSAYLLALSASVAMISAPAFAAAPAYWDPSGQQSSGSGSSSYYTPPQQNPYLTTPNSAQPINPYANNTTLYGSVSTIPAGTHMPVSVSSYLSSDNAQIGDPVTATLGSDIMSNGQVVLPSGSTLQGQVVSVSPGKRLSRFGQLQLRFNRAQTPDGRNYTISGRVATQDGSGIIKAGTTGQVVGKAAKNTIGGAALGAGLGAITGLLAGRSSNGNRRWDDYALRGAAWGGAAGLGKTAYDRGEDVQINPGTPIDVVLDQPLSVNSASNSNPYSPYNPTPVVPQTGYPTQPNYNPY